MEKTLYKDKFIEVALFDFGGVISEEGWKKGLRVIALANGLNTEEFVRTAADTIYETGYITGKARESDFWNALKRKTGITGDDASLTQEILFRFILNKPMMEVVKKLREQNLTVGILSDQTNWLDILNSRYGFFRYFDHVFNSYHLGKGKRDISLFDDIARILKTPPAKILFIDDDPGNVERAAEKGWKTILYTGDHSFFPAMDKYFSGKPDLDIGKHADLPTNEEKLMNNEIEDDITELEMKDDVLESRMKKLEKEAARLLNQSSELLQALNRERAKQEEPRQEISEVKNPEEDKVPS